MEYLFHNDPAHQWNQLDANRVGRELEAIRKREIHGILLVDDILANAKRRNTELHKAFEWNDAKAAHKYRRYQARKMMCSLHVKGIARKPVRAYLALSTKGYHRTENILNDETLRTELLEQAFNKLGSIRKKYDFLKELVKVFAEIDQARTKHKKSA